MNLTTGSVISKLPTGTVMFGNDIFPFVHGITGSSNPAQTQQGTILLLMNTIGKYNLEFFLGNGGTVVPTGTITAGYPFVEVPANTQIDSWAVYADATGSITVDIMKSTAAGFPPTTPLAGLGQPILSSQRSNTGTPTGTVNLSQGDILQPRVSSSATVKLVTVSLRGRKGV